MCFKQCFGALGRIPAPPPKNPDLHLVLGALQLPGVRSYCMSCAAWDGWLSDHAPHLAFRCYATPYQTCLSDLGQAKSSRLSSM